MTDIRTSAVDGQVLPADDFSDSLFQTRWLPILNLQQNGPNLVIYGIAGHSANTMSAIDSAGDIWQTSDMGGSWTERYTTLTGIGLIKECKADRTNAIAIQQGATSPTAITTDSGATWGAGGSVGNDAAVYDMDIPTTTLAVCCTADGASNDTIYRSTDNGANWVAASTSPTIGQDVNCISMFDGTTGYAITGDAKIWKTTNGGDRWDNTGDVSGTAGSGDTIYAISADLLLIFNETGGLLLYTNSTNTLTGLATIISYGAGLGNAAKPSHFVKLTNGNIYFAVYTIENATDGGTSPKIYKLNTTATSMSVTQLPYNGQHPGTFLAKSCITELGSDVVGMITSWTLGSSVVQFSEED